MSARRTAFLGNVVWVVILISLVEWVMPRAFGQDEPSQDPDDTREQLILFNNGRMLSGRVTRNGGGYLIEQDNGRIQVPSQDVKFVARDLRDAYRKQRDSIVEPTPATHVALANWCISHRLLEDASEELKKCLKVDPENEEARRLLMRLTDMIRTNLPAKPAEAVAAKTVEGFLQPELESLGGLSKESASLFTSRIQPLLINKCGNAQCHGSTSSNGFRLVPARMGISASRQNTERNLAETLKQLDLDHVASSRLLKAAKGSHGGKGTVFVGPAGADQMKQIRDWVMTVAGEKRSREQEFENHRSVVTESPSRKRLPKVTPASFTERDPAETVELANATEIEAPQEPEAAPAEPSAPPLASRKPRRLKPDQTDAKALAQEPVDAFDPEEFNRRFRRPQID